MKEAKRLRRKKRQQQKANFLQILGFKYRQFIGIKEPTWSPFYEKEKSVKTKDPTMSNKERLDFNRVDNGKVGKKRHGRFTIKP